MARIGTGTIVSLITFVILLVVFLGIAGGMIPVAASSYQTFSNTMNNASLVGAGAASFAGSSDDYLGWIWVAGPFLLIFGIVVSLFLKRGRR